MKKTIISVHTPKVAGTSFRRLLQDTYGECGVLLDYDDDPVNLNSTVNIDPDMYILNPIINIDPYNVVHGHFHPSKYDNLPECYRITFLRHPVENVISIYKFWSVHSDGAFDGPIFRYFKRHKLSLERFAMLPKIRFLYSSSYFGNFDMNKFNFIGDYKNYNDEIKRLENILEVKFAPILHLNNTDDFIGDSNPLLTKPSFKKLSEILEQDIEFYNLYAGS